MIKKLSNLNDQLNWPKISILTPSYNSASTIERAIKSVLKQNYPNFEHIIVDGNSNDRTTEILSKYHHIRWISEPDKGQSDAMNKAFKLSSGNIISYLNADDEYLPNIFFLVIEAFRNNEKTDFVVGNGLIDDGNSASIYRSEINYYKCLLHYRFTFPYNPVSYFYKRNVQEYYGAFEVNNHLTMDFHFILKTFRKFKKIKVEKPFGIFHNYQDNKTSKSNPLENCRKTAINFTLKNSYYLDFCLYVTLKYLMEVKRKFI